MLHKTFFCFSSSNKCKGFFYFIFLQEKMINLGIKSAATKLSKSTAVLVINVPRSDSDEGFGDDEDDT